MIDRGEITQEDIALHKKARLAVKEVGRPVLWLVWALHTSGLTSVRAITTDQTIAMYYRKLASLDDQVIKAWIEKTIANHFYAGGFMVKERG